MKPKIAYLIDDNSGWGDEPEWRFYEEADAPQWKVEHPIPGKVRRIVYWEVADDSSV